jgi:hypothetical protein
MVQILDAPESFGSQFAKSIGQGLSEGYESGMAQKKAMQELAQENAEIYKATGIRLSSKNPEMRKKEFEMKLQGAQKEEERKGDESFINNLMGNGKKKQNTSPQENADQLSANQYGEDEFDPTNISDESIVRATTRKPTIGSALQKAKDVGLRENRENIKAKDRKEENLRKSDETKLAALRAETLPIRKEFADKAVVASQAIQNKEHLIQLIETGNLDDPTYATLAEALPLGLGKRLLSKETVEYKGGLVDEFGDLKNIFKGATRVKEVEIYEDKLADIYLSDDQKKTILKSRINASKADIIRAEAAAELEAEGNFYGALQFAQEVEKRAQPKLNALFNKILDEQSAIIKDAEHRKELPLDANDPDDIEIIDQILKEAGGDYKKAEKIAIKKGYKF